MSASAAVTFHRANTTITLYGLILVIFQISMGKIVEIDEDAFLIEEFLTNKECVKYIEITEKNGYVESPVIFNGLQIVDREIRNNERVIIDDFEMAGMLWSKAIRFIPAELDGCSVRGLNERFRFYRYKPNQVFKMHRDFPYEKDGEISKLSLIVYLNSDFEGGTTKFENFEVIPKTGCGLVFRQELLHEGSSVKAGVKYAFRTDVMYLLEYKTPLKGTHKIRTPLSQDYRS